MPRRAGVEAAAAAALGLLAASGAYAAEGSLGYDLSNCNEAELDFIVLEGEATLKAMEDDIAADLAKIGMTVNARLLPKDEFNAAMVNGDFNLAFSESWGAPYDPQAFATSWSTPDEAYYAALQGLPEDLDIDAKIKAALVTETEAEREAAWEEIMTLLHEQATELPIAGKRIPSVVNRRLAAYVPGHQQFDYPAHTLRVVDAEDTKTVTVSPGAQTGLFSNETGVGRLDAHSYRPNEFFANNWVYDGLVEYGAGGAIVPALATSWNIADNADGPGKKYTFQLRRGVEFHDGAPWNCEVATLNFDHVLAPPLTTGDWHGWYGLPGMIDGWGCGDNEYEFSVTTKESYYPLLQELSFIRPLRMQSPNMFVGGLESDPLAQNSCPAGWGNITDFGVTVECAGIVGGGVSEGGSVAGTGRWKYAGTETDDAGAIQAVRFAANPDHWDAASGPHAVEELVVVAYPDHDAVKAALLDGELDAVLGAGVLTEADVAELKREHADQLAVQMTEAIQVRAPPPTPPCTPPSPDLASRRTASWSSTPPRRPPTTSRCARRSSTRSTRRASSRRSSPASPSPPSRSSPRTRPTATSPSRRSRRTTSRRRGC